MEADATTIHLALYQEATVEYAHADTLGVFSSHRSAVQAIANDALLKKDDFESYDPTRRFFRRRRESYSRADVDVERWEDHWTCDTGVNWYKVEAWHVDGFLRSTHHFNFDLLMKRRIMDMGLTHDDVVSTLRGWKQEAAGASGVDIGADGIFLDAVSLTRSYWDDDEESDVDSWVARHGSKAPWPWPTIQADGTEVAAEYTADGTEVDAEYTADGSGR